jgi:very-short-patch-repair endonuclease
MTLPEVMLWTGIRGGKLGGARFRRQHPVGPYVLEFYCDALRLAVEVDGEGHERPDQARADVARDAWLAERSIEVWRIPARDVLRDLTEVLERIERRVRR